MSAICTLPILILAWAKLPKHEVLYGAISLVFATVIQVVVGGQFYVRALSALVFSRVVDMDLLIVISSSAAYVYSVVSYICLALGSPLLTGEYFETSALLITLIMVGRLTTDYARQRAMETTTIQSLQSSTAILIDHESEKESELDSRLLHYDDLFKILPDSSVVTDGVIVSGESEIDESMITGESKLVFKKPGMSVVAGSVNFSGTLIARVTRLPGENTISVISTMVDEVKSSKPSIQQLADRAARFFAPVILGLSFIVFLGWVMVDEIVRHQSVAVASVNAMTFSISVLIVSCPCAIGLAVPMVVVIASSIASKHGLMFKTADSIDLARNISHVVFDKTGTLTQGNLHATVEEYPKGNKKFVSSIILGLTTQSKHPVSKAIAAHLISNSTKPVGISQLNAIPGCGIKASWNGFEVRAGSPSWLGVINYPEIQRIHHLGLTMFCVTLNGELVALFGLQDMLRRDALYTVRELQKRRINISILSGDTEPSVRAVATELGIPLSNIRFSCSPFQKQEYIESLVDPKSMHDHSQCTGSHHHHHSSYKSRHLSSVVLFVGDGSNDAPSLAMASIGLHVNSDTTSPTIASSASDISLLCPTLSKIMTLIDLSKAFHRRVMFNFAWCAVYNVVSILLAAGVIPYARIPPSYAGLGEAISIIPILGVSMSLRFWKT